MQKFTIALGIWGAIGPLLGILLGQFLTRSWQQQQWLLDQRKEEWRELLTTLTASFATICKLTGPMMVLGPDDMRELDEAQTVAQTTIRDRIFIAKEVKELEIYKLWSTAARQFERDMTYIPFAEQYALINAKIVGAATKHI